MRFEHLKRKKKIQVPIGDSLAYFTMCIIELESGTGKELNDGCDNLFTF